MVRKSDDEQESEGTNDKRFLQGLVRKDDNIPNGYFRFDDGLDNLGGEGFRKRDDMDSQEYSGQNKRFINGLVRKASDGEVDSENNSLLDSEQENSINKAEDTGDGHVPGLEKKFINGLVKKEEDAEEAETEKSKRFMMGVVKKESDAGNAMELDKKFINGLVGPSKKRQASVDAPVDKRFLQGLVKKEDNSEGDKRFLQGLVKKEDNSEGLVENEKQFLKGITKKSYNEATSSQTWNRGSDQSQTMAGNVQYRMKRSTSFDDRGSGYSDGPEGTWYNSPVVPSPSFTVPDKKFIRGLIRRDDLLNYYNVDRARLSAEKRFINGLVRRFDNDFTQAGDTDSGAGIDKRFIRGLIPSAGRLPEYYSKRWRSTYRPSSRQYKRFMMGLTNHKRNLASYSDGGESLDQPSKRFVIGLVKHSYPSWYNPSPRHASQNDQNGYQTRSGQA